ncbi:MAG: peptide ABC transporter substrate-binding protein [Phycisphaerae bacterium]|nr:peptide ABC transporter substrate-binding protein [Phycisphaerae bacterium]
MRLLVPFLFLLAILFLALSADHPRPRADLVIAQRADSFTLDPQRMSWRHDLRTARGLFETLVTLDPKNCAPQPGVAERWDISDQGRTYTFHLRPDSRWSNGEAVTSGDFVYAFRRALLADTAADYSGFLFHLVGGEEFFHWRGQALAEYAKRPVRDDAACAALWQATVEQFSATVGLHTPDDRTLVLTLKHPVAYMLDLLAFAALSPVHAKSVEAHVSFDPSTGRLVQGHDWTKPGKLISNGPYRLVDWRYKRDMRLEANELYWDAKNVRTGSIAIVIIEDANTTVLSAEAGGVDWVTDTLAEYRPEMLAERDRYERHYASELATARANGVSIDQALGRLPPPERGERRNTHGLDSFGTDFYSFNCRPTLSNSAPNPFHDPRVRRAFALAVDRETIVERVTRLGERPANVIVPRDAINGYTSPQGLPFDRVLARAELESAGWKDRDGDGRVENEQGALFPTVDLVYSLGSPRYRDLSFALREMWRATLGVQIVARGKETKDFRDDLKHGHFMIARGGWYGDYGDPTTFLDLSYSTDGNNDRGYVSATFDRMLQDAARELDPAKRLAMLTDAERFLMEEELPILPICTYVTVYMYEPAALTGVNQHPRLAQYFARLKREE